MPAPEEGPGAGYWQILRYFDTYQERMAAPQARETGLSRVWAWSLCGKEQQTRKAEGAPVIEWLRWSLGTHQGPHSIDTARQKSTTSDLVLASDAIKP